MTAPNSVCRSMWTQQNPLGTGGGIANVAGRLRHDTALVFNGDVLSGTDLGYLLDYHREQQAVPPPCTARSATPGLLVAYPPKTARSQHFWRRPKIRRPTRSTPAAMCSLATIDRIPRGRGEVSVEREVFHPAVRRRDRCGYVDVNDPGVTWVPRRTSYAGWADLVRGIAPSPALGGHRGEQLVHDGAAASPGVLLIGGTVVGAPRSARAPGWTAR